MKFKKTTHTKDIKPCWFFHKWEMISDNGFTKYKECKKCGCRRVEQNEFGYQPIDIGWMTYLRDEIMG